MSALRLLARVSLCFVAMTAVVGCFDPTPEYTVPDLVPPVIFASRVQPSPAVVTSISQTATSIDFTAGFRSDDAGEDLEAWFVLDTKSGETIGTRQVLDQIIVPADPHAFEEQTERLPVTWTWAWGEPRPSGCHTVTLILSHRSNFIGSYRTRDDLAAARITWFLDFGDVNGAYTCFTTGSTGGTP